jgi:hypothetical protein
METRSMQRGGVLGYLRMPGEARAWQDGYGGPGDRHGEEGVSLEGGSS